MSCNNSRDLRLLCLIFFFLFSFTAADDAAVMQKFSASLTPAPPNWRGKDFCKWDGITCDDSNSVTSINIAARSLTGNLPSDINQLSKLRNLVAHRNFLSGDLPTLANLTLLEQVSLDDNNFTSIPPDFFVGLTNLQVFSISFNHDLSPWVLPEGLFLNSNLKSFQASNAKITGTIPDFFESLLNLQKLRLSYNNLTGNLPRSFDGSPIQDLWLNNQLHGLSGTLDVLSSMTQLSQVWLQRNAFTGVIPDLSNCTTLYDLQLRDNQLTGLVPQSLMSLPKLANISLQNNKLQGPLPVFMPRVVTEIGPETNSFCLTKPGPCDPQVTALLEVAGALGYPMSLAESWKGNNACHGWAFVSCDSSGKNVTSVSLGKQKFSGTISPAFANLTSLRTILLNDNNLEGPIPKILTSLPNLQVLDVSNNNLSGDIPKFPKRVKFKSLGNPRLGQEFPGGPPQSSGSPDGSPDGSPPGTKKRVSVSVGMIVGIVIGVILFVLILLFVSYKCYVKKIKKSEKKKTENQEMGKELVKPSESQNPDTQMPNLEGGNVGMPIQILRDVTKDFSEENVLGRGGFGVVYKGELPDGTRVAVKRMVSGVMGTKGLKEFQAELGVLTQVRHRHLVALLGYCINGDERLLVYEYMPQGTLSQHLFEWEEHEGNPLSWKQRVSIALDVGRGVEYLHSLAQQSFIHRDLKPSNILLDDDMRAKVADFGLVKSAPDGNYSLETKVAGTFGYLAPEYAATGRVTTKVDVYAFGVVLMELITGRKALDQTMPDDESHLESWFRKVLVSKESIVKALDQTLDTDDEETLESICKVAELAGHCTERDPHQRPDMGHVVNVLGPLVKQWKPSTPEEEEDGYGGIDLTMSLAEILEKWQANEGTSKIFDDSITKNDSSIPSKPSGVPDTSDSMKDR